jgi:hypothetical protein
MMGINDMIKMKKKICINLYTDTEDNKDEDNILNEEISVRVWWSMKIDKNLVTYFKLPKLTVLVVAVLGAQGSDILSPERR